MPLLLVVAFVLIALVVLTAEVAVRAPLTPGPQCPVQNPFAIQPAYATYSILRLTGSPSNEHSSKD
jgi:hypothetical protein